MLASPVMDPSKAPEQARAREEADRILIAFAGDNSFNWLVDKNILPFDEHFEQLSRQADVPKVLSGMRCDMLEVCNMSKAGILHCLGCLLYSPAGAWTCDI